MGPRVDDGRKSRFVHSALHGLIGDRIAEERPHLAIEMAVRHRGRDVALSPERLAEAFPDASGTLLIFMHGMSETEDYWRRDADLHGGTYGDRLAAEHGWTPVYLRANTGLSIAENGVILSSLLARIVETWPTPVERIALVGHSMGGLILRTACDVRSNPAATGPHWTSLVTDIVTLGAPHLGSPVARAVAKGADLLNKLPETRALGYFLDHRSAGVLDLEWGTQVAPLPHVRYRLVAATLKERASHPVSALFGDKLVRVPSALGRDWTGGPNLFPGADVLHVGGADHFDLLNHPDIYQAMKEWLR
jgi:pimeloyl-ACP methyl ester carboxylesterase